MEVIFLTTFSSILKDLREAKGLTQDALARELCISRSSVGMYEKGAREPDFKTLELIADFFNVSIDYLLGRDKKSFSESDLSQEKSFTDTDVFSLFKLMTTAWSLA